MSVDSITSGELLYRSNQLQWLDLIPSDSTSSAQLRDFLDIRSREQVERREQQRSTLRSAIATIRDAHQRKVDHIAFVRDNMLRVHQAAILASAKQEAQRVLSLLQQNVQRFEARALNSMMQYFLVLKQEIESVANQLETERSEKESLKRQAKVARDILLFDCHLRMESRGKIELSLLHQESAQFQRCVRAVQDNMQSSFGGLLRPRRPLTARDVRIVNVFKLNNEHLSARLQSNSCKFKSAKLKGLFCCIPTDAIYGFAVHGLAEQQLPGDLCDRLLSEHRLHSALSASWLFARGDPLRPLPEDLQDVHNIAGAAQKLSSREVSKPVIRFSRFSTVSSVAHFSEKQMEKGVLLALCRVLIVRLKTVSGFIEKSHIVEAAANGFDAIMSSLNEEYVLLNPGYVLPEFIIHTCFPTLNNPTQSEDGLSVPAMLVGDAKQEVPRYEHSTFAQDSSTSVENVLLGNHLRGVLEGQSEKEDDSPSSLDAKQNVLIKQAALADIEQAMEEFRGLKSTLLRRAADNVSSALIGIKASST